MSKQGYCDDCGHWDSDLVDGDCPACRDKYQPRTINQVTTPVPVPPALAGTDPALRELAVMALAAGSVA